jgi:hypothetical protein
VVGVAGDLGSGKRRSYSNIVARRACNIKGRARAASNG